MTPRRVAALLGVVTLAGAAWWMMLYLSRWEWHRAIIAGIFVIAAEVGLVGGAIITRLGRLEERVDRLAVRGPGAGLDDAHAVLHGTRPGGKVTFSWLQPRGGQLSVFVPILMGAGFLLSAAAWVVERLARATARPVLERDLARRLAHLSPPFASLVPEPADPTRDPAADDPTARLARPGLV